MGILTRPFFDLKITLTAGLLAFISVVYQSSAYAQAQTAAVGAGAIWLAPKPGESTRPKPAPYRAGQMLGRAVTTNTWYSSLAYGPWSDVLHAHPLTFKATQQGMEMGMPQGRTGAISAIKNWAAGSQGTTSVTYPHQADFTVAPTNFEPKDAKLLNAGDWNITVEMRNEQAHLRSHIMHGSPFAHYEISNGGVQIKLGSGVQPADKHLDPSSGKLVHYFKARGHTYGLYLPLGAQVTAGSTDTINIQFDDKARYFSTGVLPQSDEATRKAFADSAFVFVDDTTVQWAYDEAKSLVTTDYSVKTRSMDGRAAEPLMGLYLHHQRAKTSNTPPAIGQLPSVRGPIAVVSAQGFRTELRVNGLMPMWPALQTPEQRQTLVDMLLGDKRRASSMFSKMGNGTYWSGKALGAVAQLMTIAEQQGDEASAAELEKILKQRMESWFSGKGLSYFAHDAGIGTVIGYPEEYFSVSAMNDHHFHYGYWIMAAAHLARRDPQWASANQWGGMVNLLIRDIATSQRKRVDFPFLRNFDVYEGHSWARGNSEFFGLGNDQESSSEAIHAWAAIAQWGQATADPKLQALGMYLYATEASSVLHYWFDAYNNVFPQDYRQPLASMIFGGGYGFSTWWTEEPRQIMGINLLPITPASVYLAQLPTDYVEKFGRTAEDARKLYDRSGQSDGTSSDIWQDIYAAFLALKNPSKALETWNSRGSVEVGETRSHTYFWLHALAKMGAPDSSVWANVMSHAVFKNPTNGKRTYLAYNPSGKPIDVLFSDGTVVQVQPNKVASYVAP